MARQVIELPGLGHSGQPIPLAVKIGGFVFTGSIGGADPKTGDLPAEPEAQIANAFANMKAILEAAGGDFSHVAKVEVRLSDRSLRSVLNKEWVKAFPNENDRPARHTGEGPTGGSGSVVQMEMIAVLNS